MRASARAALCRDRMPRRALARLTWPGRFGYSTAGSSVSNSDPAYISGRIISCLCNGASVVTEGGQTKSLLPTSSESESRVRPSQTREQTPPFERKRDRDPESSESTS